MIEMLGVLAIIGVLSAGGIMGYTMAMENYRVNKAVSDFQTMAAKLQNVFYKRGTWCNSIGCMRQGFINLYNLGVISKELYAKKSSAYKNFPGMCQTSGVALYSVPSPWNTDSTIYQFTSSLHYYILRYQINNVPKGACVKILTGAWQNENFYAMSASQVTSNGACLSWPKRALTVAEAEAACTPIGTYGISITFEYRHKP